MELGLKENYKIEKENNKTRQQTKDQTDSSVVPVFNRMMTSQPPSWRKVQAKLGTFSKYCIENID